MISVLNRSVIRLVNTFSNRPIRQFQGISFVQPRSLTNNRRCFSNNADWHPPATRDSPRGEISILKENISPEEILTQAIKSATRTDQLLLSVDEHIKSVRPNIALHALRTLFQLYKSDNSIMSREEIVHNKTFEALCKSARSGLRLWSSNNLIEILKIVLYFKVPPTSIMVQSVLHLLKKDVNDLNISEIIFLHMLCSKTKNDASIKAIQIALPIVFEANIQLKLDRENMGHVAEALDFSTTYKVSEIVFDYLVTVVSKLQFYDVRDAYKVARACAVIPLPHPLKGSVCAGALDYLMDNNFIKKNTESDAHHLLDLVTRNFRRDEKFYHERFFNTMVNLVIQNGSGSYIAILTCRRLMRANFGSKELLDFACEEILKNPEEMKLHAWIMAPFELISMVAKSGYMPAKWKEAENLLLETIENMPEGKFNYPWTKLSTNLLTLGRIHDASLSHALSEDNLAALELKDTRSTLFLTILSLCQHLKILHPEYTGPFPSEEILERCILNNVDFLNNFPLQNELESGFGGPQYVLTKVCTKMGFFADHAVLIRKGGYPVALNHQAEEKEEEGKALRIESIPTPVDSQMILIMFMRKKRCSPLPGLHSFRTQTDVKCLEKLGYKVAIVKDWEWNNLSSHEKVPFLMQTVKESAKEQFQDPDM